jgi:murein L,D-transpeptidase YcbB/YkuD
MQSKVTRRAALGMAMGTAVAAASPAQALVSAFTQAIAERSSQTAALAAFYRGRDFAPIWMGAGAGERRAAFLWALDTALDHGLPVARYDATEIRAAFAAADDPRAQGLLEVRMSEMFLAYANDVSSGVTDPARIDPGLVLSKPTRDPLETMQAFATADPRRFVKDLWPTAPTYVRLLREKLRLEDVRAAGGWGPEVRARKLEPGDTGDAVIALRNRLIRMGYLARSAVRSFDGPLVDAVRAFQIDHGLAPDSTVGSATLAALNVSVEGRLNQILVGLERQRWLNKPLGSRHILVNLADFHAYVVDDGKVSFETVVVVGANSSDRRTPEFSDQMEYLVINPTWHVPRSIATKEYLPALQEGGASYLRLFRGGREVSREGVDFSQYDASTFPYDLKQPPSPGNALGLVKFMFPNRWNIYLHDTPSKSLFGRNVRAFSHGCVRVQRPFELAHHLLARQEADPVAFFQSTLDTRRETYVYLDQPVGVHIVYWTSWVTPQGRVQYRDDVYGRDRAVLGALEDAGVGLRTDFT